jgi:hypothetical protein
MKMLLSLALLAVSALCSACSSYGTTEMGAGPAVGTVCADGTVLPPNSRCALHGGSRP